MCGDISFIYSMYMLFIFTYSVIIFNATIRVNRRIIVLITTFGSNIIPRATEEIQISLQNLTLNDETHQEENCKSVIGFLSVFVNIS